jgi:hypothetical protein
VGIIDELASSLGRRDEQPNFWVAESLADDPEPGAVAELVEAFASEPAALASDAATALQKLAELDPAQVAPHAAAIAALLASANNRLVWGAATILHGVAAARPDAVRPHVGALMRAVAAGSVITQDHGVGALAATGDHAALDFAFAHLRTCGWHFVPLRAERVAPFVGDRWPEFRDAVESRLPEQNAHGARRIRRLLTESDPADSRA